MTRQDWVIIGAGWLALAIMIAGLYWDLHHVDRRLRRAEGGLQNRHRRLLRLEQDAADPATSRGAVMPPVTGEHRAVGGWVDPKSWQLWDQNAGPDPEVVVPLPDQAGRNRWAELLAQAEGTVELAHHRPPDPPPSRRPPSPTIESVLAHSDRPLSRTEIAAQLGQPAEDITGELRAMIVDHVATFALDTLGRTVYDLAPGLRG